MMMVREAKKHTRVTEHKNVQSLKIEGERYRMCVHLDKCRGKQSLN